MLNALLHSGLLAALLQAHQLAQKTNSAAK